MSNTVSEHQSMSERFGKHQVRVFMVTAVLILGACSASILLWGDTPVDLNALETASAPIIIAACGMASGFIVVLLLFLHDYAWWGNARDSVVFIGMGAFLTTAGATFQLIKLLRPFFE